MILKRQNRRRVRMDLDLLMIGGLGVIVYLMMFLMVDGGLVYRSIGSTIPIRILSLIRRLGDVVVRLAYSGSSTPAHQPTP